MQKWFSLLAVCAIALAGCNASNVKDGSATNIISAEFGLLNPTSTGGMVFTPTNTVPLVPYQSYGWQILLRDPPPTVKWQEEFTLPTKPTSWGSAGSGGTRTLSADGKTLVTEAQVAPAQGMIANSWQILPGDPQGRYVMRVSVDGTLVKTFQFDVE
jgi:hypothetical protein